MNQRIALAGQYNQTWWGGKEPKKSFFFSSTEIPSRGIKGIAKGKRNRTERIFNDIFWLLLFFFLFLFLLFWDHITIQLRKLCTAKIL